MQVPLLALAGLILVEFALGGTPRILFMELGAYQVPARDTVRRSLAAPWRRRIGDWAARTVSTRS